MQGKTEPAHKTGRGIPIFIFLAVLIFAILFGSGLLYHALTLKRTQNIFQDEVDNWISMVADSTRGRLTVPLAIDDRNKVNEILLDSFGFSANVVDVMIFDEKTGALEYDRCGRHEAAEYGSLERNPGSMYYETEILPPGGMGFVPTPSGPQAKLVIEYVHIEPVTAKRIEVMLDYSKKLFHEISAKIAEDEMAQTPLVLANAMKNYARIGDVQMIDSDGIVFAEMRSDEDGNIVAGDEGVPLDEDKIEYFNAVSVRRPVMMNQSRDENGSPIYEIFMPLLKDGRKIGAVRIEHNIEDFMEAQRVSRRMLSFALAVFLVSALVGVGVASLWIGLPVSRLSEAARKSGEGESYFKADIPMGATELLRLADAFNSMLDQRREYEESLIENEAQLRALSQQIISMQEEERESLARDIHDELGHQMLALKFKIETLSRKETVDGIEMSRMAEMIQGISDELMRIYKGLSPVVIGKLGLTASMEAVISELQEQGRIQIDYSLDPLGPADVPSFKALNAYRIFQEALNNVIKHSNAGKVDVELRKTSSDLTMNIKDNGSGFNPAMKGRQGGIGLVGMRERAILADGAFTIKSETGCGTEIRVTIPLSTSEENGES